MTLMQHLGLICLGAAIFMLTACDRSPTEWKTPNMTELTPRLKPLFEKTKIVCFGRFLVDVPESATVVWGNVDITFGVRIYPNGADQVKVLAQKFVGELKGEKSIYHNYVPLLISEEAVVQPEGKIVTGYDGFDALDDLEINGYFSFNNDGVVINSRPLKDKIDETIAEIKSIAGRVRSRVENEIPTEPGNCIEHAFLADKPHPNKEPAWEHVRVGFRLKEFPDTHLSIYVAPSNPGYTKSSSLEWRLDQLEKNLKAQDPNHPQLKTRYLRRGNRQIHDWLNGYEALSHTPEQPEVHGIHDFVLDVRGVPSDLFKPHADLRMQTGVANNAAGATKASLTDEEAIAVWDKITSTIRVRPTSAAPVKTAGADPSARLPLGELAATGRVCPQTGLWEPGEPGTTEGQRRHIKAGEPMPHVISLGEPSLWQKLKGERPSYRTATVWKLVGYEEPAPADMTTQTPTIAQAVADNPAANGSAGSATAHGPKEPTPPQDKG
jgi:hypothetical protein